VLNFIQVPGSTAGSARPERQGADQEAPRHRRTHPARPWRETPEQAEAAVRATRYPPEGIRVCPDPRGAAATARCRIVSRERMPRSACSCNRNRAGDGAARRDCACQTRRWRFHRLHRPRGLDGNTGNPTHPEVQVAIRSAASPISAAGKSRAILQPGQKAHCSTATRTITLFQQE